MTDQITLAKQISREQAEAWLRYRGWHATDKNFFGAPLYQRYKEKELLRVPLEKFNASSLLAFVTALREKLHCSEEDILQEMKEINLDVFTLTYPTPLDTQKTLELGSSVLNLFRTAIRFSVQPEENYKRLNCREIQTFKENSTYSISENRIRITLPSSLSVLRKANEGLLRSLRQIQRGKPVNALIECENFVKHVSQILAILPELSLTVRWSPAVYTNSPASTKVRKLA